MTVEALAPGMTGKWTVRTVFSDHLFDLDLHLYRRKGETFNPLRKDDHPLVLHPEQIIRWPQVGSTFVIVVTVTDDPTVAYTARESSPIVSITPVEEQP